MNPRRLMPTLVLAAAFGLGACSDTPPIKELQLPAATVTPGSPGTPTPAPVVAPRYDREVEQYLEAVRQAKKDHADKLLRPYGEAVDLMQKHLAPNVPAKEREASLAKVVSRFKEAAAVVPVIRAQVAGIPCPPACAEARTHYLKHLDAFKEQLDTYSEYAKACAKGNQKSPEFQKVAEKLRRADDDRERELVVYSRCVHALDLGASTPSAPPTVPPTPSP